MRLLRFNNIDSERRCHPETGPVRCAVNTAIADTHQVVPCLDGSLPQDDTDFLTRYRRSAAQAAKTLFSSRPSQDALAFADGLFETATSREMLDAALLLTIAKSSSTAGIDALCPLDLENDADLARGVSNPVHVQLRDGSYCPSRLRRIYIKKPGGRGERPIDIPTVADRIVDRALLLTLTPILEAWWHDCCVGFRSGWSRQHGLAQVEWYAREGYTTAVAVDIRQAFTHLPKQRVLDAVRKALSFIPERLAGLLDQIILRPLPEGGKQKTHGLPQGSPLSPMLLNIFLGRILDHRWDHQQIPMVRYADDILLLARNEADACTGFKRLVSILQPYGLQLREEVPIPVQLSRSALRFWLGYDLNMQKGELIVSPKQRGWQKLAARIGQAARDDAAGDGKLVHQVISSWLENNGPVCRPGTEHHSLRKRFMTRTFHVIGQALQSNSASYEPSWIGMDRAWYAAGERWQGIRASIQVHLENRLCSQPLYGYPRSAEDGTNDSSRRDKPGRSLPSGYRAPSSASQLCYQTSGEGDFLW